MMETPFIQEGRVGIKGANRRLLILLSCGIPLGQTSAAAQERESLAGERAAQALRESADAQAQQDNLHYGPVAFQVGAGLHFSYVDNAFYSQTNRLDDLVINPEVNLGAFMQVSELNTLKLSLGLRVQVYLKNRR